MLIAKEFNEATIYRAAAFDRGVDWRGRWIGVAQEADAARLHSLGWPLLRYDASRARAISSHS